MSAQRVLIVGAGHAGGRVAQHLCTLGFQGGITLAGCEPHPPYERPALSKELLQGRVSASSLTLSGRSVWLDNPNVRWIRDTVVMADVAAKRALFASGAVDDFDLLVVATGAEPRRLSVPGAGGHHVHHLRSIDDSLALRDTLSRAKRIVIIGGGVIGLEVAAAAVERGTEVTILEAGHRVMGRAAPEWAATWLTTLHRSKGVLIETRAAVLAIEETAEGVAVRARRNDHDEISLPADFVLVAIGVVPNLAFLAASGLPLADGLEVNDRCQSASAPFVYAAGDAARTWSPLLRRFVRQETWRNAENQGRAVAEFICGRSEPYVETPWMWTDQFGCNLQIVGLPSDTDQSLVREPCRDGSGAVVYHREGVVSGAVLVNQGRQRRWVEQLIRAQVSVDVARLGDPAIPLRDVA
jgi:3-phenylpropionate/trans-cinnamate dioxygenase ferredoxin reductase subunit